MDKRYRFVVVGSGWRSLYYVRIAKALPDMFELGAMLCRTQEKADKIASENGIHTTTSVEECIDIKPDFVVVAVNKNSIAEVSMEWMKRGFTVLCETPAAIDTETLSKLWELNKTAGKLVVAEQYTHYPSYGAMVKAVNKNMIGEPDFMTISLAHGYHGVSLMRALMELDVNEQFSVRSKIYEYPTVETMSRYEKFTDGRISNKKREVAIFEFANGKTAVFDFDPDQYRSPIRNNTYKIQGCRGEFTGDKLYYLDDDNAAQVLPFTVISREVNTEYDNPNLRTIKEVTGISLGDEALYEPYFGLVGLAEDETAIAIMMKETAEYSKGIGKEPYPLSAALQDAYASILMAESVEKECSISSRRQIWN